MEKYFGEKQERFSFRKLSVGLVSATISSLFFMSVLASSSVDAQETAGVHYKYVADSELSSEEKKQLVYDIPTYVENDDETYYLVYKLNSQNQLAELPNTGSKNERQALVAGASLAALGILIFAVSKKKVKNKTVLHLVLVAGIGNGVLVSVHALENHLLLNYNTDYELTSGEKLPLPKEISGYTYIGYIKEGKTTSDFEVSNQEKSAATPTKQQKVDYNVTPNFVDHPSTVQAIQEQTPVSSTKPTEVQVVEKPFSTELINPRKEEKQSSDSQEQLAEHKNLETKKEEKISPKEKTGVNTLNPQDEVLSGQLNKPELLYREETIETKIDFQEEIQENPDLAEGTVRVKQEGKLGKKVEIVRIFSVNKEEVSREIVSTSTTAPSPRIVEKGTKKTQVIKEQPETGVEHKDVQSGAIVEPAIQPELPEAVVSDKGEPEVQPTLPEAVVTDKGETEVQPESPDTVVSDKGEPEQVAPLPEYKGNIEQVKPETPVEKTKEQGPEKTEEVPVKPTEETPVNPNEGTTEGTSIQEAENPVQPAEESTTNSEKVSPDTSSENTGEVSSNPSDSTTSVGESNKPEHNDSKNENSEKTVEEVPVKPTEETPVNPNEGTTEGTSIQEAENPVQPAEESTTNSEKVSPDTSSENTGEVSSNPSDSTTSVGESNKPEHNDSKNENSEKTVEEVPVNPNEGTVEGTSNQETEKPVQPAEETQTNSGKIANENTGEVSNKPSDSKPPVEESNQPEKNGTATKPENSGNTTSENGQPEPEPSNGNSTEDVSTESNTSNSNGNEEIKQENELDPDKKVEDPEKKLELRNVSDLELYSLSNGTYKQHISLEQVPSNPNSYFVKVKSSSFKDVYLPVASISEERKNDKILYKITAKVEKLQQEIESRYKDNFTFYLAKKGTEETTNFTSFSNLVKAINQNLAGTYHLAASLNANEVELANTDNAYIKGTFTGKLIGKNNGKHYAIYNLKKSLFDSLSNATVENLSLKSVNISGKNDIGSLANEAKNGTTINEVHVDGLLGGERGIGGLVAKVDQSNITNSSFTGRIVNTYETKSAYNIGGLVGHLTGDRASINSSKSTVVISSNTNSSDQTVGGIAGLVDKDAHIQNSYSEGDINNSQRFGKVAGIAGNLWDRESNSENHAGRLTNVLSDVNVTNGNAISGYHYNGMKITDAFSNKANKVFNVTLEKDEVVSKESFEERGTMLDASQIASKKAEINLLTPPIVEPLSTSGKKDSDFSKIAHYQANRALVYKNIEKLLPFYNKATIVKYGNLVKENSILYQKELLSAVMMKDDQVITDIISNKQTANKLLLHYKDHSSEKLELKYKDDFANLAEYSIGDSGLLYTPNQFLYDQTSIINQVLPELNRVNYQSDAVRNTLGISPEVKLTELYLEEQFTKTKQDLANSLKKLLSADAGLAGDNPVTRGYLVDKIKNNKEALLLGLTYLERWYNFSYGQVNVKDLVMYHPDFFGKGNTSPLDTLIELGKSGFNNLLAKNNVDTYAISLASHHGTTDLFSTLENYRKVFLPDKTNNDWFKSQTKAYIVEEKSNIEEVKTKQELVGTKYSIGVYDRITSATWKYRNMVLPLLTLPERSVFVISTISSLGFGAYDRYRNKEHQANGDLNSFVEKSAHETAERQRDHYDYWYRILDEKGREKLYRNILLYDAYKFGTDHTEGKATEVADFDSPNPAMKHFFGPVGNKVGHNGHGAYATGDAVYYMGYRMLDKDGAITYTHEMTHDSDQDIYLGGYGRRSGLGPEFFAKGLLQAPDQPSDATITINSILKHKTSDSTEGQRLQVLDPTTRFNDAADLQNYVHNMFDVVYMLEYLEGQSIVKQLDAYQKMTALRKIENKYVKDPADGNEVYATNVVKELTEEEARNLNSFDSLIDNNILSAREYKAGTYERNGYFTIKLFAPIFSALSSEKGTPGDLMGRRMAYELLAAKGFKDGMVPYISNQFEADARANNKTITSYGKTKGLVTDTLVLQKLFNGQYNTWSDFKKAMYKERQDKFNKLNKISFKDPSQPWTRNIIKTIHSVNELQNLMNEAVRKDTETPHWYNYNPEIDSAVHKLKRAIFKAYLDQTNDFRSSIFENKK
ncbi:ZmpA/ZmpB/ZmpC family metallo-endopeptidase [Streptococcus pneumoniae]|uniref:ZmpA/ZmpB/ZmpC family metallo-endopeptidase n=1 Tax=Streptococcus pneumoniae TaxID=1313 RepID=UPI0007656020|nr:ZmpA/ZmpB/ZmpC family metallo-endopeptidase [Streptococcus pneumoniae]MCG8140701.1 G5 domain-containing protein [Streptococcus pneumoniae]MCM0176978.1 G5 domain-containing protein [Streptococcus pneumoniae]MDV8388644.1 G5 domain-containing protein [Streptococcus pneumoniae]MDV8685169.1 G5 domain-containing protein [Streptococcus pneumoniae]CVK51528.1 IgA-protease [Streptococcus pneumoniae]